MFFSCAKPAFGHVLPLHLQLRVFYHFPLVISLLFNFSRSYDVIGFSWHIHFFVFRRCQQNSLSLSRKPFSTMVLLLHTQRFSLKHLINACCATCFLKSFAHMNSSSAFFQLKRRFQSDALHILLKLRCSFCFPFFSLWRTRATFLSSVVSFYFFFSRVGGFLRCAFGAISFAGKVCIRNLF